MKKIISFILVALLCIGVFAACTPKNQEPAVTLDDAKTYLANMYKDSADKLMNDYDVVGKVVVSGVSFTVTWKVDVSEITIKESDKANFWTVDLPDVNAKEKAYVLTATITDADGNTATVTLNRILPVYEKVSGAVTNPVAETAYKLFFKQVNIGKTLFLTAEDTGKFIKTNVDPKAAADFYVEVVDGGVKIFTKVGDAKKYLSAAAVAKEDGKISKSITFGDEGSVFTYNKTINAWYTVINNIKYCMGTYSTYDTVSISEDSYYSAENTGVEQFPVEFILKAEGEAMAPTQGPADPTELTSIVDVIAIGAAKEHNAYTVEKYLVKGKIVEIKSEQYGNMYIADDNGNQLYIYGLYSKDGSVRYDGLDKKPAVGDTITVMSIVGQYNDEPQLKNAWLMELESCDHEFDNACDTTCNKCEFVREITHDTVTVEAVEATCTATGKTAGVECKVCGYKTWEVVEIKPHEYHLTEKDDNVHHEICKVCPAVKEGSEAEHTLNDNGVCACGFGCDHETTEWKVKTAATCTSKGVKEEYCTDCGKYISTADIAMADHSLTNVGAVAAGCTTDGAEAYSVCSVCGAKFNEAGEAIEEVVVVPATGHNYVDGACSACGEAEPTVDPDPQPPVGGDDPVGEAIKITIDNLGVASQSYAAGTAQIGGAGFEFIQIGNYGDGIQMRDKEGNTSMLWNTTAFNKPIIRIDLVYSSSKDTYDNPDAVIFNFGNTMKGADYTAKLSTTKGVKTYSITPNAETYTYLYIEHDLGYSMYWESITIVFADGTSVTPPAGGEDPDPTPTPDPDPTPTPDPDPEVPAGLTALTELKDGDVVVIAAPAYNKALSATKVAEFYNVGVDISGGLSGLTDAEKFRVTKNSDGSYTFTSLTGDVIALADSYSSLNVAGANKSWTLEAKSGATGVFYVKNTVRGNYLEWYASKNNWSSYATSSFDGQFEISFYAVG